MAADIPFEPQPGRGRFDAAFFRVMDGYIDWNLRPHEARVYVDLPPTVVEVGPGVGATCAPATCHTHPSLREAARWRGGGLTKTPAGRPRPRRPAETGPDIALGAG